MSKTLTISQKEIENRIFTNRRLQLMLNSHLALHDTSSDNPLRSQIVTLETRPGKYQFEAKKLYHIGASLKDLGKKWFAFSKMDMEAVVLLNKLKGGKDE